MNEAERCDRVSLMHAGKVLAVGKPAELARQRGNDTLEEAFVDYLKEAAGIEDAKPDEYSSEQLDNPAQQSDSGIQKRGFNLRRWWAYAWREALEIFFRSNNY